MGTNTGSIAVHVRTHPRRLLIVVVIAGPMPALVAVLVSRVVATIVAIAHITVGVDSHSSSLQALDCSCSLVRSALSLDFIAKYR